MGCRDGGGVTISGGTGTWWYHSHGRMPPWGVGMVGGGVTIPGGTGTWWYHSHGRISPRGVGIVGGGGNHLRRYWDMVVS